MACLCTIHFIGFLPDSFVFLFDRQLLGENCKETHVSPRIGAFGGSKQETSSIVPPNDVKRQLNNVLKFLLESGATFLSNTCNSLSVNSSYSQ